MNDGNNDDNEVDNSYASNEDDDNDDNELDDDENDDNEDGGNEAVQNAFEGDESNLVPSLARWKKNNKKNIVTDFLYYFVLLLYLTGTMKMWSC